MKDFTQSSSERDGHLPRPGVDSIVQIVVPSRPIRAGLFRFLGAIFAVMSTSAVSFGYAVLYGDELDPGHPANIGAGIAAPMYRHWIEGCVMMWTTLISATIGFYVVFGKRAGVVIVWPLVRWFVVRLHFASGVLLLTSLLIDLMMRGHVHLRDVVLARLVIGCLVDSVCGSSEGVHRRV